MPRRLVGFCGRGGAKKRHFYVFVKETSHRVSLFVSLFVELSFLFVATTKTSFIGLVTRGHRSIGLEKVRGGPGGTETDGARQWRHFLVAPCRGQVFLPPPNTVRNLCLAEWAKRLKAKRDGAHIRAAAAVGGGRGGGGSGGKSGAESGEESEEADDDGDDDDDDDDAAASASHDGGGASSGGGGGAMVWMSIRLARRAKRRGSMSTHTHSLRSTRPSFARC